MVDRSSEPVLGSDADDSRDRVAPRLSLWAAALWGVVGAALVPAAVSMAMVISSPGGFERGDPAMLLPLVPVVCGLESGFHVRRFVFDRRVWLSLDPKPLRSPLWWLIPFPRPRGRLR
ncbi:hypothetical protein [Microbacterium sp. LWO12-1.2]|uniref:hypothetical protein n=1 Tax=Microbacterium sp. LWO12-1.2 TaxID=3135261 RepID=UPI003425D81D